MSELEFDYVIVGAGSAGCVLANRLSADPNNRVALLEAGPKDRNIWIHIPAGYFRNVMNPAITYQFASGPEPGLGGRTIGWPRGRVLGGSSAINGLLYVRGQTHDFDVWRQLGNVGWSHQDVLPYFKKSERREGGGDDTHGGTGELGVANVRMDNPLCEAFIQACEQEGIPRAADYNGPDQEGVAYYQLTNQNGRRSSTAVAFLRPALGRPNLTVVTEAVAQRLELAGRRVTGVTIKQAGVSRTLTARREVILSGGAIGSPQLLQVSGIGPGAALQKAGVTVRHDLAGVGENLQDHYQARFVYECNAEGSLNDVWHSRWKQFTSGLDYIVNRRGILTIGAGVVAVFAKSHSSLESPDIQFHFIPLSADGAGQGLHAFPGVISSVCQLRPESRGRLAIKTPNVADHPAIVSNYLVADKDQDVLLAAMKMSRRIVARPAFAKVVVREHAPGLETMSDAALLQFARDKGTTIYHPCGTCKMGVDAMAVVDPRLSVKGLTGLRIADASIMPTMTSGNTNAPTIMIAEKAADMILTDARAQPASAA